MQPRRPTEHDLVLLGGGHAHVAVLRRFAARPPRRLRLTLVARAPLALYSGMLPGLLRGVYRVDQAAIDLAPLAAAAGTRLLVAEATAIDLAGRQVTLAGMAPVPFDLLSVDVGGVARTGAGGIPVKPVGDLPVRLSALESTMPAGSRIAVVGGGAGGIELTLALASRWGAWARLTLVCDTPEPLAAAPPRARAIVRAALLEAGVALVCGVAAGAHTAGRLALSDGSFLSADAVLWATAAHGPAFLAASGLACDASGCIRVGRTLRSLSHTAVFAAGDCATIEGDPRPKAGVWAVRAGAPLAANLRRAARGRKLRAWRPQRQALAIIGLGDGRAVGWRNRITLAGTLVWRLKDWLDRRWIRRLGATAGETGDGQPRPASLTGDRRPRH